MVVIVGGRRKMGVSGVRSLLFLALTLVVGCVYGSGTGGVGTVALYPCSSCS